MASVTFKGSTIETAGDFPVVGQVAPEFKLIKSDLSELTLADLKGKKVVFNIIPSIDTPVCALQLQKFSQQTAELDNTILVFASLDLPFALGRFCAAENIDNAITTSDFRFHSLAANYGVELIGGPLDSLYARAVLVLNEKSEVIYSELVAEVTEEPNYAAALASLTSA